MSRLALYVAPTDDRRTVAPCPWELILDPRLKPISKLLGAILWGHMNPSGYCDPGQDTLASIAGVGTRHIQRAVRQLRDSGWIEVEVRSRGADKQPSRYYASHPLHGRMKRPKVPEQMALALVSLQRGPVLVRTTQVSHGPDTGVGSAHDTGVALTKAVTTERCDGLRQEEQPDPDWQPGGAKFLAVMDSLKAAHVPTPRRPVRRDGAR